jgi:uncharacterized protein YbcI
MLSDAFGVLDFPPPLHAPAEEGGGKAAGMSQADQDPQATSTLMDVSNAMVQLHKEQFGRGPTKARSHFAGPDALVCVLQEVLLPAERKLVELGDPGAVRDSRVRFQVATTTEFVAAVEQIVQRRVRAFASAIDPVANVVFENFWFEPSDGGGPAPIHAV